jgi:hypothetical protein
MSLIVLTAVAFVALGRLGVPSEWDAGIALAMAVAYVAIAERVEREGRVTIGGQVEGGPAPRTVAFHAIAALSGVVGALAIAAIADSTIAMWVAVAALLYLCAGIPIWLLVDRRGRL